VKWKSLCLGALLAFAARAEEPDEQFSLHFQATVATQAYPSFFAAYTGAHSLTPDAQSATSVVTDLFAGARLWPGAEVYFQPTLSGGSGLSSTLGVAAFPSGEVYRVGNTAPAVSLSRLFFRQTVGLGGGSARVEPGPNQLGLTHDRDTFTVTVGRLAVTDTFDHNPVANDPHTGFLCWGLFASAAYDYPADTRGYTWGVSGDLAIESWSLRAGMFLEPRYANLLPMIWNIADARGLAFEGEYRFDVKGHKGGVRALAFVNNAPMGSYDAALEQPGVPNVRATRVFGRLKSGFAASANLDLNDSLAAFARLSYNDGQNETWAFTEIDRSAALGAVQSGSRWGRPLDTAGVAVVVSGLSGPHRQYLARGGEGFLLGDGALRYGPELVGEVYYLLSITKEVFVGGNYQPIWNPGYNRDRGPVSVYTGRVHVAF
jgi:high affinity Mn2+ porin